MKNGTGIQRVEQFIVFISTFVVIYVNYLAATGHVNHITPKEISDKYSTMITPAGYAFSIWGVIYLFLIFFSVYQALPSQKAKFRHIRRLYLVSCAANIGWLFSWHYDQILISLVLMFVILTTMFLINRALYLNPGSGARTWLANLPFGLYFGWITAASILNCLVATIYLRINLPELANIIIDCALIGLAAALAILVRRNFDNLFYALAVTWALTAIAVNHQSTTAIFAAALIGAIISFLSIFLFRKNAFRVA